MSITIDQLFYGAYREAGQVLLEQTGLNPDQTEEARQVFNKMVDAWALDGGTISHVARMLFPITPSKGDYTVGKGGDWDPGTYPVRVERASMVLTTQSGAAGPPEYPIWPLTIDEWQSWVYKGQSTNYPRRYFYEPAYPLGVMHLLYVPTDSNQVALYLEETLQQIDATGDALLDFRPGYQELIESNLAVRIAARTPGSNISPDVKEMARASMSLVKATNNRPLSRANDMTSTSRSRSNVFMGNRYSS